MKEKLHWPETLRSAMDEADINNVALGREIGVSHVAIGNYLKGDKPKSEHLLALANFFKVPMDWFFGRTFFLDALEKKGIEFERRGSELHILLKEEAAVTSALREMPEEHVVDDLVAEVENLKEQVRTVERLAKQIKMGKTQSPVEELRRLQGVDDIAKEMGRRGIKSRDNPTIKKET